MFYQKWKLAIFALIMMLFSICKMLGKKSWCTSEAEITNFASFLNEIIKGSRMIKFIKLC